METIEAILSIVVYSVFLFKLEYRLAIVVIISGLLMILLPRVTGDTLSNRKNIVLEKTGSYTEKSMDLLDGYQLINENTLQNIKDSHYDQLKDLEDSRLNFGKYKAFTNVFNGSVMYIINILSFIAIAILLSQGKITAGTATATFSYIQSFYFPLRGIVDSLSNIKAVSKVSEEVAKLGQETYKSNSINRELENSIRLVNVSKKIGDLELRKINLKFNKGEKYLITGKNGSGKSTLLNIIYKNIGIDSGEIFFDNIDYDNSFARNNIYFLRQDSHIFRDNFINNATVYGSYDLVISDYMETEKLERLKNAKNSRDLSGGEKQLLSLIRAISSGNKVILLDEPFAAVDRTAELNYTNGLINSDATIIMVSHNKDPQYLSLFENVINLDKLEK